jgi:TetR/AcrR family transcriptional regulator
MTRDADGHTEKTILEAAEQLFLDKGFALTSTTEIAEKAGCNQALIHYYFRTKEKLFEAIFEEKARIIFSNVVEVSDSADSFEEGLSRAIEVHFDMLRKNPRLPFLVINELTTNPSRLEMVKAIVRPKIEGVYSRLERWIAEEVAKGGIRPIEPFDLIYDIITLNAAIFLAAPIFKQALNIDKAAFDKYLDARKKANVEFIINSLRP